MNKINLLASVFAIGIALSPVTASANLVSEVENLIDARLVQLDATISNIDEQLENPSLPDPVRTVLEFQLRVASAQKVGLTAQRRRVDRLPNHRLIAMQSYLIPFVSPT